MALPQSILSRLLSRYSPSTRVIDIDVLNGGSINQARLVQLSDGTRLFVKYHADATSFPRMFTTERLALELMKKTNAILVPEVVFADEACLILKAFTAGKKDVEWRRLIGRQLAHMHSLSKNPRFGFEVNNYLGTTPQSNTWCESWLDFWRENRLGIQIKTLRESMSPDERLIQVLEKLFKRLEIYLTLHDEPAVLLHGDLWSGNAAATQDGVPIIFDPASYYGQREAEFGMMQLFGGFGAETAAAYQEVWPLPAGSEERINIYRLYHEVNHLILFGTAYYQTALTTASSLL